MRAWINKKITFIYFYLSAWYSYFYLSTSFHSVTDHIRALLANSCRPMVATFNQNPLSLSLSSSLSHSLWWQAKLCSATIARSAYGTFASPAKSHATRDSTASAVLGKQVRRPGFHKSHRATFCTGTGCQYTSTPTANKKIVARFVTLQKQQLSVFHKKHY